MSIYDTLNPQQKEAVFHTKGPLLLLAGAGSGKTRVLVHRIAYLMEEEHVNPWNIMAITFTNKAAGEMRERVNDMIGFGAEHIWVSTFHSSCVRILRRYIDRLGYDNSFTIYDTDDQKTLIKEICKYLKIDTKQVPERSLMSEISKAKDEFLSPSEYEAQHQGNFHKMRVANVYKEYQKRLKANNALDFDDLLFKTVELFQFHPDVLEQYQERFQYIMIDEYQDTNHVQFLFVSMLAGKYRNLCVVGDDDQSIYKFRGANIYNILNFEKKYEDATVIKLEQNYRSTQNILNAANEVIRNNTGRKSKTLWTANEEGECIAFTQYDSEYEEAEQIVDEIERLVQKDDVSYQDIAILNRTNAQSRIFEERFILKNIPYKVVGGVNFYQRKEIKDLVSYLKMIHNGQDDLAVRRIINVPKRGIGLTTIERIQAYAISMGISFSEAMFEVENIPNMARAISKINEFTELVQDFRRQQEQMELSQLFSYILEKTGYIEELRKEEKKEDAESRINNLDELLNKIVSYEQTAEQPSLGGLLEEIALVADIDNLEEGREAVVIMTLHSAKGLEFPYVFMGGMENGIFPSYMTMMSSDPMEIEEERRLCYVGITRAKKQLYLSAARRRMVHGQTQFNSISQFIHEIPRELLHVQNGMTKWQREQNIPVKQQEPKKTFLASNPYKKQPLPVPNQEPLQYKEGDCVKHMKFGKGKVLEIRSGGKDYEVTVEFEKAGVKKMFASFAKLVKL